MHGDQKTLAYYLETDVTSVQIAKTKSRHVRSISEALIPQ